MVARRVSGSVSVVVARTRTALWVSFTDDRSTVSTAWTVRWSERASERRLMWRVMASDSRTEHVGSPGGECDPEQDEPDGSAGEEDPADVVAAPVVGACVGVPLVIGKHDGAGVEGGADDLEYHQDRAGCQRGSDQHGRDTSYRPHSTAPITSRPARY
jgi:hypothetical protein